jgi:hypothetical protein
MSEVLDATKASSAKQVIERELDRFNTENIRYMSRVGGLSDWLKARKDAILAALGMPAPSAWRTDGGYPKHKPFLVALANGGVVEYHVARWKGADKSILVIGSMFAFDHIGKIIGWREFDAIDADEQGSVPKCELMPEIDGSTVCRPCNYRTFDSEASCRRKDASINGSKPAENVTEKA